MKNRFICAALCALMACSAFAGCSSDKGGVQEDSSAAVEDTEENGAETEGDTDGDEESSDDDGLNAVWGSVSYSGDGMFEMKVPSEVEERGDADVSAIDENSFIALVKINDDYTLEQCFDEEEDDMAIGKVREFIANGLGLEEEDIVISLGEVGTPFTPNEIEVTPFEINAEKNDGTKLYVSAFYFNFEGMAVVATGVAEDEASAENMKSVVDAVSQTVYKKK